MRWVEVAMVILVPLAAGALPTGALYAQQTQRLVVAVTSASGRSVFLDHGRAAGIAVGMRVRLLPPGAPAVEALVRAVSTHNARADLPPGLPLPPVGTPGELEVVPSAAPAQTSTAAPPSVPEHPPWTREEAPRTTEMPILAPAFGRHPGERPMLVRGRVFGQLDTTIDRGAGRRSEYYLSRVGTRLQATNVFGAGGTLQFSGELARRGTDLLDEGAGSDDRGRIDRVSYAVGGEAYAPYRAEFGRFVSRHVPELGLFDGVEGVVQLENGLRAGVGLGAYPLPFPARATGDDLGAHVFVDYTSDDDGSVTATLGLQKTWHEGAPDRDLLLARGAYRPSEGWWLYGSGKLDFYSASDPIEGPGIELTEAWLQVRFAPLDGPGASLSFSHFAWPELKRREYQSLPIELVRDGRTDRLDLSAWHDLTESVRLTARVNAWEDQSRDGTGGTLTADCSDVLASGVAATVSVLYADGSYSGGPGVRLQARRQFGLADVFFGYDWRRYRARGLLTGTEHLTSESLHGGVDMAIDGWNLSLSGHYDFGNAEDSYGVGLYAGHRF